MAKANSGGGWGEGKDVRRALDEGNPDGAVGVPDGFAGAVHKTARGGEDDLLCSDGNRVYCGCTHRVDVMDGGGKQG